MRFCWCLSAVDWVITWGMRLSVMFIGIKNSSFRRRTNRVHSWVCGASRLGVWTYTDLTVRFDYDYHVIGSVQFDITMHHGELTMHCILNYQFHFTYNFVNKYKQSDIWTEPLIWPAQRKGASWMYQTSNKTKSEHRRQQEHLEQIQKSKY